MWHIIAIGYLFVTVMFAAAQPSVARALIYLVFWSVLPSLFVLGGENAAAQPAAAGAGKASRRCRIKLFTRPDILYNAAAFIF